MRTLPAAFLSFALASVAVFVACTGEELNPGSGARETEDSGATADAAGVDGSTEGGVNAGASCSTVLKCIQGCKTAQCATDCTGAASPTAKGIIQDLQTCTAGSKETAPCVTYCTASDGGAGDGGDAGDAGPATGPDTPLCSLCVLKVCKPHLDACAADK